MQGASPDPLAQLRDIHLPPPVSWWPPAPGWWGVALVLLLLLAALVWWLRRPAGRRQPVGRSALAELARIEARFKQTGDSARLAAELSILLRQVAISRDDPTSVAALKGEAWLAYLDQTGGGEGFRHGPGQVLISAPYQRHAELEAGALIALVRQWLARHD